VSPEDIRAALAEAVGHDRSREGIAADLAPVVAEIAAQAAADALEAAADRIFSFRAGSSFRAAAAYGHAAFLARARAAAGTFGHC
jgi:hypothetical protein